MINKVHDSRNQLLGISQTEYFHTGVLVERGHFNKIICSRDTWELKQPIQTQLSQTDLILDNGISIAEEKHRYQIYGKQGSEE